MKFNVTITPTNKDGKAVVVSNAAQGASDSYALVKPGFYTAVVEALPSATYQGKKPDYLGRTPTYAKLRPQIRLQNEAGTIIKNQDWTLAAIDPETGELYRIDGDPSKPILFGGNKMADGSYQHGAYNLLLALGLLSPDGRGGYVPNANTDAVSGVVVRVEVKHETFTSNGKEQTKNIISRIFGLSDKDIDGYNEEHEDFPLVILPQSEDGSIRTVFITEAARDRFLELRDREDAEETQDGDEEDWK